MPIRTPRRSHLIPRTRDGRIAAVAFLAVFLVALPPVTHSVLNRTEPWLFGVPFLYAMLLVVYVALIGILIWVWRRRL